MGMDFCALLKCDVQSEICKKAITLLENELPDDIRGVKNQWQKSGFIPFWYGKATWVTRYSAESETLRRPSFPEFQISLRTDDAFYLTFGFDAVCIYHPLRWFKFLTEPEWQVKMLNVCNTFADLFSSPEGIITRDESPVIIRFYEGASFNDSLSNGKVEEGEVQQLIELYKLINSDGTWDSHGYYKFR